jgi:DNA-directed RNA polymerase subunit N (RpoN/RPB10)
MALNVCKGCGSFMPGIIYKSYLKEVEKQNIADGVRIMPSSTFVPVQTEKGVGSLLNDLGLVNQCCRTTIMTFHHS